MHIYIYLLQKPYTLRHAKLHTYTLIKISILSTQTYYYTKPTKHTKHTLSILNNHTKYTKRSFSLPRTLNSQ